MEDEEEPAFGDDQAVVILRGGRRLVEGDAQAGSVYVNAGESLEIRKLADSVLVSLVFDFRELCVVVQAAAASDPMAHLRERTIADARRRHAQESSIGQE